jgi:bloom syndrome protein
LRINTIIGGGKSLCYQLPASLTSYRRGTTVVFSPLISLIQDQCAQLSALDIPNGALNAATTPDEYKAITQDCRNGVLSLLYITPEKLGQSAAFMTLLENMHSKGFLAAFVIDEAHCVSQWGHDFRKDYLQLKTLKQRFPSVH